MTPSPENPRRRNRRRGWRPKVALLLAALAIAAIGAELACRIHWRVRHDLPLTRPGRVLYAIYPELAAVDRAAPARGDGHFDILMLGGSVLDPDWGAVETALAEQLAATGYRHVRVFNVATAAQTSRDSRLKYEALRDARFDAVLFYHGVNEARANNVPPDLYRDDYGHYAWYETANMLAESHGRSWIALPYTLRFLASRARQRANADRYVPAHAPRAEWVAHGNDLRSVASFEANVGAIAAVARARGDRLLLMTFASHVPADYSWDAFQARTLDYAFADPPGALPLELWGRPEDVQAAMRGHNAVLARVAAEHDVALFDMARAMQPASARDYNDPCHLTPEGSSRFASHLVGALRRWIEGEPGG